MSQRALPLSVRAWFFTPHAVIDPSAPYAVLDHPPPPSTVHRPRSPRSPRSPLLMIPRLTTPLDMVRFFLALHVPFTIHIYVDVSIKLPKTDVGCHLLSRPRLSRVSCVL